MSQSRTPSLLLTLFVLFSLVMPALAQNPSAGANVNMVSGTDWTTGDPFLQRQNEPSAAVSTRNSLHLLAGANDYRFVDLPGLLGIEERGDAWLGVFKSFDGGQTWQSTLLPGYPLDSSTDGLNSPVKGLQAGADPAVRAGTNGLFYFSGLAFNRGANAASAVFVSRFIDNDNRENGDATRQQGSITNVVPADSIRYLGQTVVSKGTSTVFLDKPWIAVDVPRGTATCTINFTNPDGSAGTETIPAGIVFISYSAFDVPAPTTSSSGSYDNHGSDQDDDDERRTGSKIFVARSTDCGATFSLPVQLASDTITNQASMIAVDPSSATNAAATVYVVWRRFASSTNPGGIVIRKSTDGGLTFGLPKDVVTFPASCLTAPTGVGCPIDQPSDTLTCSPAPCTPPPFGGTFRSNTYPTMAVDDSGRVYVAWSQRQSSGDARIVMSVSGDGQTWPSAGTPVDLGLVPDDLGNPFPNLSNPSRGHQLMPSLSFNAGKLMLAYYDLRQDHTLGILTPAADQKSYLESRALEGELDPTSPAFNPTAVFNSFVSDSALLAAPFLTIRRHTIDMEGAQASPMSAGSLVVPSFTSFRISRYQFGINPFDDPNKVEQLQLNTPNLPIFVQGTQPFIGDYIDVAGAPSFVFNNGKWTFNTAASSNPVFHAVWTDNRDVRPPSDGNWTNYTPPFSNSNPSTPHPSVFDPTQNVPACSDDGHSVTRNQNIYTSRIAPGIYVVAPGNSKTLGFIPNTQTLLQREFAITVQNTTTLTRSFRITIANQPLLANGTPDPAGSASVQQFGPIVTFEDVTIDGGYSISRPVFVQSANPTASVTVNVQEISAPNGTVVSGGLSASTTLNPDPTAPQIIDPQNPTVLNPTVLNAEVYNPTILNPTVLNPTVLNPTVLNPTVLNPTVLNPTVLNPAVSSALNPTVLNPTILNPTVLNPTVLNPALADQTTTDTTYTIQNAGNTVASYAVKLFGTQPAGTTLQLILTKTYLTPISQNCQLASQSQNTTTVSIPDPVVETAATLADPELPNSSTKNATINLRPGETALVTVRANVASVAAAQDIANNLTPVIVSHAANTGANTPPATLAITTTNGALNAGIVGVTYSFTLGSFGGNSPVTWALISGGLPPGLTLDPLTGIISGTPTQSGSFGFAVSLTDSSTPAPTTAFRNLSINIAVPLVIGTATVNDGVIGFPYNQTLTATGGNSSFTWSLFSGSLPAGLALSPAGSISGTPTGPATTSSFVAQVQDSGTPQQTKTVALSIRIAAPLVINTGTTLPDAVVGVPYSATLQAGGGIAPILWSVTVGAPPAGLQLSTAGVLSGTPTAASPSSNFTAQAQDSSSPAQVTSQVLSLHVATPLSVATLAVPDAIVGVAYQQQLAFSGGTGAPTWKLSGGSLPPGLSLSTAGLISGTPTTANVTGTPFTVQVTDSGAPPQSATRSITLRVAARLVITTTTLAQPKFNTAYSQPLAATGGIPPLIWSLAPGSGPLPGGLSLSATGVITGTPNAVGTFNFTVQVADSSAPQQVATKAFTLTVAALYNVTFYVQPSNSSPNTQITPSIKVLVTNPATGKGVSGVTVTLTIAVNPGNSILSGTTVSTTGNNGIAIFASNSLNNVGTGYVLQASTNLAGAGTALSVPFSIR